MSDVGTRGSQHPLTPDDLDMPDWAEVDDATQDRDDVEPDEWLIDQDDEP